MLTLSSPLSFPNSFWALEESSIRHEEEFNTDMYRDGMAFLDPNGSCESFKFSESNSGGDVAAVEIKKLSHNANERDRGKRINALYSSLRSLLPASDQTKKLISIPATISCVLKYIPELQKQLERLQQKKEELASRISRQESSSAEFNKRRRVETQSSIGAVSVNRIGERQVIIHLCINNGSKVSFADAISCLEKEGVVLTDSSLQTIEQRVFCTFHLQMNGTPGMEVNELKEKLLSCFEKKELLALI